MADPNLTDLLDRAHAGEVLGEALFAALVSGTDEGPERTKLEGCRLLEEQTRDTIAALASDLGVVLGDGRDSAEAGRRGAEALAALPWRERMAAIAAGTGAYRSLYGELGGALAARRDPRLDEIVAHEHALTGFARTEADGHDGIDLLADALSTAFRERLDSLR